MGYSIAGLRGAIKAIIASLIIFLYPFPAEAPTGMPHIPQPLPVEQPSISPDTELLARLIYAEARGESYRGKVAVGAVVMNRVRDKDFPGTIKGVIYQQGQFAPIASRYNDDCLKAAREAMSGADPTGGAMYFFNPRTATDRLVRNMKVVCVIGEHRFAR